MHGEAGIIFAQHWHVGRVAHSALQPDGGAPLAPSAIQAERVKAYIATGPDTGTLVNPSLPRALSRAEITDIVALYVQSAKNALSAGFDGVEIHAANGYLVNQFISMHANTRQDDYGGLLANRLRFLREIVQAASNAIGLEKLGVRFTPLFTSTDKDRVYIGLVEDDPHKTYVEAVKILQDAGVAYVSIAEVDWENAPELPTAFRRDIRAIFSGRIIYVGRYTPERGARLIENNLADLIAFGRPFMANPDLPERFANGWPLNALDPGTLYGGASNGFTDYPEYAASAAITPQEEVS